MQNTLTRHPLKVSFRANSPAEKAFRNRAGLPEAIAPGISPTPSHDLHFHGGRTIQNLRFMNFYVGNDAWPAADKTHIDTALSQAMADPHLNNVMAQYFHGPITTTFVNSTALPGPAPTLVTETDVRNLVQNLHTEGRLAGQDLTSTVFNFLLPPGTVLNTDTTSSSEDIREHMKHSRVIPHDDEDDSLHGLGGYHGSIHIGSDTIYYAVGVYSQKLPDGTENGIPVFPQAWKNVVATFYHELNEARTDPDVDDAIAAGNSPNATKFLGWTSKQGEEVGDFPVFEAGTHLNEVFKEVHLTAGKGTVPVQFQYSNAVHGPEGPISQAHPPQTALKQSA